ncbi:MAG: hypothetical protein WCR46_15890 [Deltaproteobacteria bacterium]
MTIKNNRPEQAAPLSADKRGKLLKNGGPRSTIFYYLHQVALNTWFWQTRPCSVDYLVIG